MNTFALLSWSCQHHPGAVWWFRGSIPHTFRHVACHTCHLQHMLSKLALVTRQDVERKKSKDQTNRTWNFCSHSVDENSVTWSHVAASEVGTYGLVMGTDRYESILVGSIFLVKKYNWVKHRAESKNHSKFYHLQMLWWISLCTSFFGHTRHGWTNGSINEWKIILK